MIISNIYSTLQRIENGQKLFRNFIPMQERSILDSLVETKKLMLQDGYYSKINKIDRQK